MSRTDGRVRVTVVLLVIATATAAAALGLWRLGPGLATTGTACVAQRWSRAQTVFNFPAGEFLRHPMVITSGSVRYAAGLLTSVNGPISEASELLVLQDGRDIGVPAGGFTFQDPLIFVDLRGALHLLWGELPRRDDPADAPKSNVPLSVSIWHSVFVQGRWSPPKRAYVASGGVQRFWWTRYGTGLAVDSANRVHVALPGAGAGILHLALDGDVWSVDTIPGAAMRTAVAAGPHGRLYLVLIGRAPGTRGRSQTVKLRQSQDGGRTWTQPKRVRGGEPAYGRLQTLLDSSGALHLVFGVVKDDPYHPAILRQTVSNDGGRSWSRPHDLKIPAQRFTKWSAALDGCGAEHVIVYTWSPGTDPPGRLFQAQMIRRGWSWGWSPLRVLPAVGTLREAEFADGAAGVIDLLYSREIAPDDLGVARYQVVRTTLEPGTK